MCGVSPGGVVNDRDRVRSVPGMPARIQLKRTRGWRMPANTVKVDRSTRWGNPLVARPGYSTSQAVADYALWLGGDPSARGLPTDAVPPGVEEIRRHLAGKNLACWCPLDGPCHAEILLRVANAVPRSAEDDLP